MPHITITDPIVGQPDSSEEPKIPTDLDTIVNVINGNLDATNMAASFLNTLIQLLGSSGTHNAEFGTGTITGPYSGASTQPDCAYSDRVTVTFATAFGGVPSVIAPFILDADSTIAVVGTPSASSFQVQSKAIPAGYVNGTGVWGSGTSRTSIPFCWLAIA